MRRSNKALPVRTAGHLVVGCAASIVIAWACWVWSPARVNAGLLDYFVQGNQTYAYGVDLRLGAGRRACEWVDPVPTERLRINNGWEPFPPLPSDVVVPKPGNAYMQEWCGWPFAAMQGEVQRTNGMVVGRHGVLPLPGFGNRGVVEVPARPTAGLIIDTLVFAAVLALLQRIFDAAVRWIRRRRNHCEACNYDRHGVAMAAPCPECGSRPSSPPRPAVQPQST